MKINEYPVVKAAIYSRFSRKLSVFMSDGTRLSVMNPDIRGEVDVRTPDIDLHQDVFPDEYSITVTQHRVISGGLLFSSADSFEVKRPEAKEDGEGWYEWDFNCGEHGEVVPAFHKMVSFTHHGEWGRYYGRPQDRDEFLADIMALCEKWGEA